MGGASKGLSVIGRFTEFISAAVVAGLVGEYLHYFANAGAHAESKMVYTVAIAGISLVASMVFFPPLKYNFWAFPLDYALFICWMVAFGLLVNLSGGANCTSTWYWNSWGYYWGGYYRYPNEIINQSIVGTSACSKWRATLSFSFIGGMAWLGNGILGTYVILKLRSEKAALKRGEIVEEKHASGWQGQARRVGSYVGYHGGANGQDTAVRTNNAGDVAAAV